MATPTTDEARDQALDMITQVQEAGLRLAGSVVESWAAVLRSVPNALPNGFPNVVPGIVNGTTGATGAAVPAAGLPRTAIEAVDRFYDTGVQVLEAQRSAAHHVIGTMAPVLRPLGVGTPPSARR